MSNCSCKFMSCACSKALRAERDQLKAEVERLLVQVNSRPKLAIENAQLRAEVERLKRWTELPHLVESNKHLRSEVERLQDEVERLRAEVNTVVELKSFAVATVDSLRAEVAALSSGREACRQHLASALHENEQLMAEMADVVAESKGFAAATIDSLRAEMEELSSDCEAYSRHLDLVLRDNEQLTAEVERLKDKVLQLQMVAAPGWAEDTIRELRTLVGELVEALDCYWKNCTAPSGGHPQPGELLARAKEMIK